MRLKAFVFGVALLSLYVAFSNMTSSSDFVAQATRSENVIDGFIVQAAHHSGFPLLGPDISPLNLSVPALTPLRQIDREKYTVRINTWRRPELLLQNVAYLSACEGVAEIQVVWCDVKNDPPADLTTNFTNVKVDRREINSLNERFNLSGIGSPTLGIIHVDDDDLFSCIALDNSKYKAFDHKVIFVLSSFSFDIFPSGIVLRSSLLQMDLQHGTSCWAVSATP